MDGMKWIGMAHEHETNTPTGLWVPARGDDEGEEQAKGGEGSD